MKIITLNLRNFTDDHWNERLPLIGKDIIKYGAGILAFQEVRGYVNSSNGKDMAQQVQDYLREHGVLYPYLVEQKAMDYPDIEAWEGLAILSKLPISDWGYEKLDLGGNEDKNKRIMLWARFDLENGPIYVSNNHFSYVSTQAQANTKQVISILNRSQFKYPGLLVGDLNVAPTNPAIAYITDNNWIDIWAQKRPEEINYGFTFAAGNATERIDYQFKNQYFVEEVRDIDLGFTQMDPDTGQYPSDHYGVIVTL